MNADAYHAGGARQGCARRIVRRFASTGATAEACFGGPLWQSAGDEPGGGRCFES